MTFTLPYSLIAPQWSPDGSWLLFNAGGGIGKIRYSVAGFDTSSVVWLTDEGRNFFPTWSGDGRSIAYSRSFAYPEEETVAGIYVMDADGNNKVKVRQGYLPDASWNPLGPSLIYFKSVHPPSGVNGDTLIEISLTSGSEQAVFYRQGDHYSPRYSPDGTLIAFFEQPYAQNLNLWVYSTLDHSVRRLTDEGCAESLSWSPDGQEIAYIKYRPDDYTYDNGVVWIVNLTTMARRRLTENPPPEVHHDDAERR